MTAESAKMINHYRCYIPQYLIKLEIDQKLSRIDYHQLLCTPPRLASDRHLTEGFQTCHFIIDSTSLCLVVLGPLCIPKVAFRSAMTLGYDLRLPIPQQL